MKTLLTTVSVCFAIFGLVVGANTHTLQDVMAKRETIARQQEAAKWIINYTPKQLGDIKI